MEKASWVRQRSGTQNFKLPKNSTIFKDYYNDVQGSLKRLAGMDDFLTGQYTYQYIL